MSLKLKEEFIMKFVKVDKLPEVKRTYHPLQAYIEEFMKLNTKVVLVELKPGEYSNIKVAHTTIWGACRKSGYPVTCSRRNGKIYLVRKDME